MANVYNHRDPVTEETIQRIEILEVKRVRNGNYILKGRIFRPYFDDQLSINGFSLVGYMRKYLRDAIQEIHAFYAPEGKMQLYYQAYTGRWINTSEGEYLYFTPRGKFEKVDSQQYKVWLKMRGFTEYITLYELHKNRKKVASTQLEKTL